MRVAVVEIDFLQQPGGAESVGEKIIVVVMDGGLFDMVPFGVNLHPQRHPEVDPRPTIERQFAAHHPGAHFLARAPGFFRRCMPQILHLALQRRRVLDNGKPSVRLDCHDFPAVPDQRLVPGCFITRHIESRNIFLDVVVRPYMELHVRIIPHVKTQLHVGERERLVPVFTVGRADRQSVLHLAGFLQPAQHRLFMRCQPRAQIRCQCPVRGVDFQIFALR